VTFIGCCFCICCNGFIFFFRRPIHIVITLNGLMTRNLIFKGKKLKVKLMVEKALMGKKCEEDEVSLKREKNMLDLMKKNEKLKMKLQQEKKIGTFLFFLFVISWVSTIVMVLMLLFKVNCNV